MTVIHKVCGTKLISSGRGDFGYCPTCKCDVHHLVMGEELFSVKFSDKVIVEMNQ